MLVEQTAGKTENRTVSVYKQIKSNILVGKLVPGERVLISKVCDELGVSLGAVREALSRLVSDGLVVSIPQKGFQVAPLSRQDLEDITIVRIDVECLCLERALEHGNLKWESGILSAEHELSRYAIEDSESFGRINPQWAEAHERFHFSLVSQCGSPWLLNLRANLYAQSERYRLLSVPLEHKRRAVVKEHRDLAAAAINRDQSRVKTLISEHFQRTTQLLLDADFF